MSASSPPAPPDLNSAEQIDNPWPGFAVLRDHYPVYFDEYTESWLISRYEDVRRLVREIPPGPSIQDLVGQYYADATNMMAMVGREHRDRRRLLAPFFSRSGVESYDDLVERRARALLEPIFERERRAVTSGKRNRGEMDFIQDFTEGFTVGVMGDLLGLDLDDRARLREWFEAFIAAEGNLKRDPQIIERALRAKDDCREFIAPIISERRHSDGDDLISRLCRAQIDGFSLSDEEIRSIVVMLIIAGGETTDHQLGWLMYELTQHPDQQEALARDRSLMDKLLAESMRYDAIVQYMGRIAPEDLEVRGVQIPAGAHMALCLAAANHDPLRFRDPDRFNIFRDDHDASKAFTGAAEHMGFGSGHHFCMGSHQARAEMEVAINLFFDNVRDVRLADGFEARANPEAVFVRALSNLRLSFELR